MTIHIVLPGEGEVIGGGPIKVRVIEDGAHTEHRLGMIEGVVSPGTPQPPLHVHRQYEEVFIVTAGKLRFMSDADPVDLEAGSVVVIPIGTAHTFSNPFDSPATVLNAFTADSPIQYLRDLAQLLDERGTLSPTDFEQLMARYATDVVRPG